jgi:branched-chain amino acid transport system ATP-binding protein
MSQHDLLTLDAVHVSYGPVHAVRDVSMAVAPGEVVTIIGANGAGKSTLLNAIAGLRPLASGRILLEGRDLGPVPAHRRVGLGLALSPEGRRVFPDQTVRDNLVLGAYSKREGSRQVEACLAHLFELFPRLEERRQQAAGTLSGGEQQMLAIARALMSEPSLLLLDEPSLGLAPMVVQDIFRIIRMLRDLGLTIVLVEQMASEALAAADRAYVLETGRITITGRGRDLLSDPRIRAAYLGVH